MERKVWNHLIAITCGTFMSVVFLACFWSQNLTHILSDNVLIFFEPLHIADAELIDWIGATSGWAAACAAAVAAYFAYNGAVTQIQKLEKQIGEAQKANKINQAQHVPDVMQYCSQELRSIDFVTRWLKDMRDVGWRDDQQKQLLSNYNNIWFLFFEQNENAAKYNPGASYQKRQEFIQKYQFLWAYHLMISEAYNGAPIPDHDVAIDAFSSVQAEYAKCLKSKQKDPFAKEIQELEDMLIAYKNSLPDNWIEQLHEWRESVVIKYPDGSKHHPTSFTRSPR
ncbi:hypothetical protein [Pseudovibrio sp. Alg231-02]|uniref:hypothetical protein n=1 Tax=Pseudovibrio sp. Alg231-02 TaxID=1922223 RepID=UPI000D552176|nr:hypothetical protein [Pseudovibrio sp. Alg231-02]